MGMGIFRPFLRALVLPLLLKIFLKSQKIQIQYAPVSQPGFSNETIPAATGGLGLKKYPDRKAKVIYTEIDIEELALSRSSSLVVTPEVVLTDAAREKLFSLGIRLVKTGGQNQPAAEGTALTDQLSPNRKTFYTESDVVEISKRDTAQNSTKTRYLPLQPKRN